MYIKKLLWFYVLCVVNSFWLSAAVRPPETQSHYKLIGLLPASFPLSGRFIKKLRLIVNDCSRGGFDKKRLICAQ